MVEELRSSQESNTKSEFQKLKKELSEKERQINSQNLNIDKLKQEIGELKNTISELGKIEKPNEMDSGKIKHIHKENNEINDNLELPDAKQQNLEFLSWNFNHEVVNENDSSKEKLLKENQFLIKKFNKYQNKYIKFKYKYEELKSFSQIFASGLYNQRKYPEISEQDSQPVFLKNKQMRSNENLDNENKNLKKIANKSAEEDISNDYKRYKNELKLEGKANLNENNSSEIFEKDNLSLIGNEIKSFHYNEDLEMEVDECINEENSIEIEKDTRKNSKKEKKEKSEKKKVKKEKSEKKNKKEIEKVKDPKVSLKSKKDAKNLRKKKADISNEINSDFEEVKNLENDNFDKKNMKEELKNETLRIHINPIKKTKLPIDELSEIKNKKEAIENELIDYINSINVVDTDMENINTFFHSYGPSWTSHEKIFNILEIVFSSPTKIKITKAIFFFANLPLEGLFSNIKEFLLSHMNIILAKNDFCFLESNDSTETKIVLKNIFSIDESSLNLCNYLNTPYFISFILAILFKVLKEHTELFKFLIEILEIDNEKIEAFLKLFKTLLKTQISSIKIENEAEIENYTTNFNRIYFMHSYRKIIFTRNLADFTLEIIENKDNDEFIMKFLTNLINEINENVELQEIKNNKINFALDINYLEIFQVIYLLFKLKSFEWMSKNIFENLMWNCFLQSKEGSLKRVAIIYYISYIMSIFIAKDYKCENENTKSLINWVYAIFDPKFNAQMISAYDKIAALSGFIDTHVIQYDKNVFTLVKSIIEKIIHDHGLEIFPEDFIEKLKKLNIYSTNANAINL